MVRFAFIFILALAMFAAAGSGPRAGTVRPVYVLCPTAVAVNDSYVTAQLCNAGNPGQRWTFNSSTHALELAGGHEKLCMDVSGKLIVPGAFVIVWTCNGQHNQQWELRNKQIRVRGGNYCLTIQELNTDQKFKIYLCHESKWGGLQRWEYVP